MTSACVMALGNAPFSTKSVTSPKVRSVSSVSPALAPPVPPKAMTGGEEIRRSWKARSSSARRCSSASRRASSSRRSLSSSRARNSSSVGPSGGAGVGLLAPTARGPGPYAAVAALDLVRRVRPGIVPEHSRRRPVGRRSVRSAHRSPRRPRCPPPRRRSPAHRAVLRSGPGARRSAPEVRRWVLVRRERSRVPGGRVVARRVRSLRTRHPRFGTRPGGWPSAGRPLPPQGPRIARGPSRPQG